MIDVLKRSSATEFHADPELISPEVRSEECDHIGMSAVLHHKDLLLNDGEVITWFQFDYLNGGQLASGQASSLQAITQLLIKIRGRGVSGSI